MVFDPSGELIAKDTRDREGVVITELKADQLERVRGHRMRYFLPNQRDDLFSF
jgi:N-carbamoylputrescine amidase